MANPKYVDLPGIAHDQPDVYETSDLPEAEQTAPEVDQSDVVQQLTVSASEAYNKFKDKRVDASSIDFTDSIAQKRRTGYDVRSGNWEMLGEGMKEEETPQQRYQRLQHELRELMEDVNQMKDTVQKGSKEEELTPVILAKQVENLQGQLMEMNMEKMLGTAAIASLSDPHGFLQKKLLAQLDNFTKKAVPTKPEEKTAKPVSNVTYELHVKPELAKLDVTSKVSDLEHRLKNLENAIGKDKQKLSNLTSHTNGKSLLATIQFLSARISLLDPSHLDQVEGRLISLHQRLLQVSEKKKEIEDTNKQNEISELYDLLKKTESMTSTLPEIADRLVALKELHEQALQFSKALMQLDTEQQQIASSLKKDEKLLQTVQEAFAKNTEVLKNNMSSLEARISALKK